MSKSNQEFLCNAIKRHDILAFKLAMANGADLKGSIQGKEHLSDFRLNSKTTTPAHLAVHWAKIYNKNDILLETHKRGVDLGETIKEALGNASFVKEFCGGGSAVFIFIHDYYPDIYGDFNTIFDIFFAVKNHDHNNLELLIKWGQDVNQRDEKERTPLMYSSDVNCSKTLISSGADPKAVDNEGKTVIWHAIHNICKNYDEENGILDGNYGANLGWLAETIGIDQDKDSKILSEKLLDVLGEIDKTDPGFVRTMPGFNTALHQTRTVTAKARMENLDAFLDERLRNTTNSKKNPLFKI